MDLTKDITRCKLGEGGLMYIPTGSTTPTRCTGK
jgi:hypothetical protein